MKEEKYQLSHRLKTYLQKVEEETGRPIKILESKNLGVRGISVGFRYHPQYILIIINPTVKRSITDLERSIAHEATHGYILHRLGYCRPLFSHETPEKIQQMTHLLFTMVEDLVVNKIIQDNGFLPFGSEYIPMLKREVDVAEKGEQSGESFYHLFSPDPQTEDILMISRYIIAWGFLNYHSFEKDVQDQIQEFLQKFQQNYSHHYPRAKIVQEIILKHDIFTAKGQCEAIKEIIALWGLENQVMFERNSEKKL
ncbi:MAG: hypothetical protein ACXVZU_00250 [Methanobacteriaceae archaeon]